MKRFEHKTVIVTGGGGGIGGATARRFAREGARVAVFDLNLATAEQVAADIRAEGGTAQALLCDITDRASVDAAVAAAEQQLGAIDVLVNNAGWDVFKPFTKTEPAQWDKLIAINLVGALHLHHAVLPGMAARRAGRIVNIASDAARVGSSGEAVYAACKGGLVAFSKTIAREHARHGITVNVVCPGPTDTALFADYRTSAPTRSSCWAWSAPSARRSFPMCRRWPSRASPVRTSISGSACGRPTARRPKSLRA